MLSPKSKKSSLLLCIYKIRFEKLSSSTEIIRRDEVPVSDYLIGTKRVQQMMTFKPNNISFGTGLYNAGNTCYVNSVLQTLSYTRPLVNYLLSSDHSKSCKLSKFCMMCVLERHVKIMLYQDLQYHVPREILLNLSSISLFYNFLNVKALAIFVYSSKKMLMIFCIP
jgi:ubiquitin C-terminal hydrolase